MKKAMKGKGIGPGAKPDVHENMDSSEVALDTKCSGCGEERKLKIMVDRGKPQEQVQFICPTCGTKRQITVKADFGAKQKNL